MELEKKTHLDLMLSQITAVDFLFNCVVFFFLPFFSQLICISVGLRLVPGSGSRFGSDAAAKVLRFQGGTVTVGYVHSDDITLCSVLFQCK